MKHNENEGFGYKVKVSGGEITTGTMFQNPTQMGLKKQGSSKDIKKSSQSGEHNGVSGFS